ncbi:MAG: ATP-dependent RecD-like DNA helicase, partial [Clostridia bacterium]|nr:ATP-dependent RecD-like DNA helicase [Clostridia bacterium]
TIKGTVENLIYSNSQNGYTVLNVLLQDGTELSVVGYLPGISEGEQVEITGNYTVHPKYGEQFSALSYVRVLPQKLSEIIKFLSSGIIKGVGPATAKKIADRFGEESLEIIADYPARLAEISGISEKKALEIGKSYVEQLGVRDVVMFFQRYGISSKFAMKIYQKYGLTSVEQIKLNPYLLAEQVRGIGFNKVDGIALSLGFSHNDKRRICAGVIYCLYSAALNGHSFLPKGMLVENVVKLLDVDEGEAENAVTSLVFAEKIYIEKHTMFDAVYLPVYKNAEDYTAKRIKSYNNIYKKDKKKVDKILGNIEKQQNIVLADMQKEAVYTVMDNGVTVITGGPGTGKTTIINAIIKVMEEMGKTVFLAAPTGRAAKRMTEMCGVEGKTIHRLLEVEFKDDDETTFFGKNEDNPIDCDVLIIDETSMVDILLMSSVLKALKPTARLILVGDSDQLPSVSAGYVLRDIIASGAVKTIALTEIFRQAKESAIVVNAHLINGGKYPELNNADNDFFLVRRDSAADIVSTIVQLSEKRLPNAYGFDSVNQIQVISPTRKGQAGVVALNEKLQAALNPKSKTKKEKTFGGVTFREGDKVMQNKNNYDIEWTKGELRGNGVFNGDIGYIECVDLYEEILTVVFDDKQYVYNFSQADELELAYAITVHKSQGSEFDAVVMPMYPCAPMLQNRNLLYTAVTRAKKLAVLVGREECIKTMVDNKSEQKRYSGLQKKLEE